MKLRIVLLVLTLGGALFAPGASRAATIVFDVSGASNERLAFFATSPGTQHQTAFSAGSSLTLDTDANGDGASGDYTVRASRFAIQGSLRSPLSDQLGETGLTWDIVGEIRGGSGQLAIDIYGYEYLSWGGAASYSVTGTFQCYGWACAYENLPEGVPMPYPEMLTFLGLEPISEVSLGSWAIDGPIPTSIDMFCDYPDPFWCHSADNGRFSVATALDQSLSLHVQGVAVPEPASQLLVAAALLGLALGRWASLRTLAIGVGLLLASSPSRAATLTYDLSGESVEVYWNSDPTGPGYSSTPFSGGSSLTLEFDANGDGVSGDVTVASSSFWVYATRPLVLGISLETGFLATLSGGLGALDALGNYVEWSEPASYFVSGSWQCVGTNCALISLAEGVDYSYADWQNFLGVVTLDSISLGTWQLNQSSPGDLDFLCVSPDGHACNWPLVTAVASGVGVPPFEWRIGLDLHGHVVPEPAAALLVAGGLLALALRRCASGTMRRHEVA